MRVRRLYKFWMISLLISILIAGVYVYVATENYVSSLAPGEDNDFAAVPYLVYAHILGVVCTGLLTAFLIVLRDGLTEINEKLAGWLVLLNVFGGALAFALIKFNSYILIFFNPLAFMLFASLPYISWSIANRRTNPKIIAAIIALITVLTLWQVLSWLAIYGF